MDKIKKFFSKIFHWFTSTDNGKTSLKIIEDEVKKEVERQLNKIKKSIPNSKTNSKTKEEDN